MADKGFTIYVVERSLFEDFGDGEEYPEAFGSLADARRYFNEICREAKTNKLDATIKLWKYETAALSPRAMVLALVSRRGWVKRSEQLERRAFDDGEEVKA